MTQPFEPGCGYELNPAVAIRPEPFGRSRITSATGGSPS